jgi:nitrate reductase gamma subunit
MHSVYSFVTGPLAWVAFLVFILGIIGKLVHFYYLSQQKDPDIVRYYNLKYALRSIGHWLLPFGTASWHKDPLLTIATFIFHICLILVPIFLSAHVIMWQLSWGVSYWSLPNAVADTMTVLVLVCCIYFALRRLLLPTVRFVTSLQDWLVLFIVFLTFLTGFLAYHQVLHYPTIIVLHVLSAEVLLASLPFTRLAHAFYGPILRGYIGSEFGAIRKARDW